MTRTLPALILATAALAACAKSPDAIAPVSMAGAYENLSCAAANRTLLAERASLDALSAQQRNAATGDALGVFLIGLPVSSLTGSDKEGAIATAKGKILALEARLASC